MVDAAEGLNRGEDHLGLGGLDCLGDLGRSLGVGTHGDREKGRKPLGVPTLADKIRAGRHNGVHRDGDALYVFARLSSLRWYVVVELDAERTLAGD